MPINQELPEKELIKQILLQIDQYKQKQLEFYEAFDDFIKVMEKLIDNCERT